MSDKNPKERRGRPKTKDLEENKPRKFELITDNYDGTVDIYKWDLDKNPNGMISCEINVPRKK